MQYRDALRAQVYLKDLLEVRREIRDHLQTLVPLWPETPVDAMADEFATQLGTYVDQMVLPSLAHSVAQAARAGNLRGATPESRYDSFFLGGGRWAPTVQGYMEANPYLFDRIRLFLRTESNNVGEAVAALRNDLPLLAATHLRNPKAHPTYIQAGGSERHCGGRQTLILTFSSSQKLVYKPTDLTPDVLFSEYVQDLKLPSPLTPRVAQVLPMNRHGWIEHIEHASCTRLAEVSAYYKRAGALLAIADSLNHCDGHMENLIAAGDQPVLIDCETLFHAFSPVDASSGEERSILFTGLVQKPPKSGGGYTAAFQTLGGYRYHFLTPYPIKDHTDELEVRFRGITPFTPANAPSLGGVSMPPDRFIEDFCEGFHNTYSHITSCSDEILSNLSWWRRLEEARCRQLIRHTLYYLLLTRRIEQPEGCADREEAASLLRPLLLGGDPRQSRFMEYELEDLLAVNTPYFWHRPGSSDLFDSMGSCYQGHFRESSADQLRRQFRSRSPAYRGRSIQIIRKHLPGRPRFSTN